MAKKIKTSFTLSEETIKLLKILAVKLNRSQANTIEELIKDAAKAYRVKIKASQN